MSLGLGMVLIGLGLSRTKVSVSGWWVWLSLVLITLAIIRFQRLRMAAVIFFGLSLGWWRGSGYMHELARYNYLYKRPVTVIGFADSDAVYGDKTQIVFDLSHVQVVSPHSINLVGKIGVKGFGESMVYKGDKVQITGKLYPTRGAKQAAISFANIYTIQRSSSWIERTRRRFQAGIQSALPEPDASFGLGLLIGLRSTIPQNVNLELTAVGLTHVVAVSGYNLTIIMRAVRRLLKKRSKYQSTLASLLLIGLFLLFTGMSASIVRASLVSMLSLLAWYYGRAFRPTVLILLTAVVTAIAYPLYIWGDLGWYLSFLAFYGVMVIGPLATKRLYNRGKPKLVTALIIETSAAQIMTIPIIMYIFGQFSVIALLANLLVVPLVPLGMLLCLLAGMAGMLYAPLAGWISWPAKIMLTYMLDIVAALSRLPRASIQQPISLVQMIIMYTLILCLVVVLWHRNRRKSGIITDIKELATGEV
jgi:ComEC/Rec2-related protein